MIVAEGEEVEEGEGAEYEAGGRWRESAEAKTVHGFSHDAQPFERKAYGKRGVLWLFSGRRAITSIGVG